MSQSRFRLNDVTATKALLDDLHTHPGQEFTAAVLSARNPGVAKMRVGRLLSSESDVQTEKKKDGKTYYQFKALFL